MVVAREESGSSLCSRVNKRTIVFRSGAYGPVLCRTTVLSLGAKKNMTVSLTLWNDYSIHLLLYLKRVAKKDTYYSKCLYLDEGQHDYTHRQGILQV